MLNVVFILALNCGKMQTIYGGSCCPHSENRKKADSIYKAYNSHIPSSCKYQKQFSIHFKH